MKIIIRTAVALSLCMAIVITTALGAGYIEAVKVEQNFEGFAENAASVSGFEYSPSGIGRIKTITQDYGKSFIAPQLTTGSCYISVPAGNARGCVVMEFDTFAHNVSDDYKYTTLIRYNTSSATTTSIGSVSSNTWNISGSYDFEYVADRWYHVKIVCNTETLKCDIYMCDAENAANIDDYPVQTDKALSSNAVNGIRHFRITAPNRNADSLYDGETYIAIDNVVCYVQIPLPEITGFGYDDAGISTEISAGAQMIYANLSQAVDEDTFDSSYISLVAENGKTKILENVTLSEDRKTISFKTKTPLASNTRYTLSLSENMTISGSSFPEAVEGEFVTAKADFDVDSVTFTENGGKLTAAPVIRNVTGSFYEAYAVLSIFDGDILKSTSVKKITLPSDETVELTALFESGQKGEFYLISDIKSAKMIASKVFSYE